MIRLTLAAALALLIAAPAQAGLREEADINAGLRAVAAADMIRKRCSEIEPRMVRAYGYMRGLAQMARDRGYDDEAIEAFVEDKAEKKRVRGEAKDWLRAQGLGAGEDADYCRVGRALIAVEGPVGRLLRAR